MTDQRFSLSLLGSTPNFDLTDDIIDEIEDFLLYAVDLEVDNHIYNLVQFFQFHLSNFIRSPSLSIADQHYQKRLLRAMRFFRHKSLNQNLSKQLEDISFFYLYKDNSNSMFSFPKQQAYVFLIDHFFAAIHGVPDRCQELLNWSIEYINTVYMNIGNADLSFFLTIINSLPVLIRFFHSNVNITRVISILINIALAGMNFSRAPNFFDSLEMIIAKSLRLAARLIMTYKQVNNDIIGYVLQLNEMMQADEIAFVHIYQNYLMVMCALIQINYPYRNDELLKIIPYLFRFLPFFIQMPLLKSKKISFYLQTIEIYFSRNRLSKDTGKFFNTNLWNLLSNFHGQLRTITSASNIVFALMTPELFQENIYTQITILENLVSSLELIKLDLDSIASKGQSLEPEIWLESNKQIMNLILHTLKFDSNQQMNHAYPLKLNLLVRLVRYVCHYLKEFREKMYSCFIETFLNILFSLHPIVFRQLLALTMKDLIPRANHNGYYRLFSAILTNSSHLIDFLTIFFSTLTENFEEFMTPTPPRLLLEITRMVFNCYFIDDSQNPKMMPPNSLCTDLYRFLIKALTSQNSSIFELLYTIFRSFVIRTNRSEQFRQIIKNSPFLMHNVLHALIDDPSMKEKVSLLALFLFPLCDVPSKYNELWVQLFIPAIESETKSSIAMPVINKCTSGNFAQWVSQMKEPIQSNFVAALTLYPTEPNSRILLGRIPDIACKLALKTIAPNKKDFLVIIGGLKVSANVLFNSIKRNRSPTEKDKLVIFDCYCQIIGSMKFYEAINDQFTISMTKYIQEKVPEKFNTMYQLFTPPVQYAALFLRQKYGKPIDDIMIDDTNINLNDFLQYIATLCYSKITAEPALNIIHMYLKFLEPTTKILKINIAILHASQFYPDIANTILSEQILSGKFSNDNVLPEINQQFSQAMMIPITNIRRCALKCISILEKKYGMKSSMDNSRAIILRDLLPMLKHDFMNSYHTCTRFEFIFKKPFTDVQDPIELQQNLFYFLRSTIAGNTEKPLLVIPVEVQKLFKKLKCSDPAINTFLTAKFIIKAIGKLIAVIDRPNVPHIWNIFHEMKDESNKLRQFIPYLIKIIRKEAQKLNKRYFNCLPGDFNSLIQMSVNLPPMYEDIKLFRFFLAFAPLMQQPTIHLVQWIQAAIVSNQHIITSSPRQAEKSLKQIFKLTQQLKSIDPIADISLIIQTFLDIQMFCTVSFIPIKTNFHYLIEAWSEEIIAFVISKFKKEKDWNFNLFVCLINFLCEPKCKNFRNSILNQLTNSANMSQINEYIEQVFKKDKKYLEILFSRCFECLHQIITNLKPEEFDLQRVLLAARNILLCHSCFPSSSMLVNYIKILLPLNYAKSINDDPMLLKFFKDSIMPLFITKPYTQYFQHPTFTQRLVEFMKILDEENRKLLYSIFDSEKFQQQRSILVNQILCDKYKNFPENVIINIGFKNYVKTPSFPVLILNFSAAMLAAQSCVTVPDLGDTPILTTNSYIHALAIHNKLRGIDSIKTLPRFFPVMKYLVSMNDALPPDGLLNALTVKLDTIPYIAKSSLLCFRALGRPNCLVDHTSRSITQFILGFSTAILTSATIPKLDISFVHVLPDVFKQLISVKSACQRTFELLLIAVIKVLAQMNDGITMAQKIPSTISEFIPLIDFSSVNSNLLTELKETLSTKSHDQPNGMTNQTRTKFLLQLIPVMSTLLFDPMSKTDFFPQVLQPNQYFVTSNSHSNREEMISLFQKALTSAVASGGLSVSNRIIKEMCDFLYNSSKHPADQNRSAFATIAQWIKEIPPKQKQLDNLIILLEVTKPMTSTQLVIDLVSLKQPLSPIVSNFLINLLDTEFSTMLPFVSTIPSICSYTIKQSTDIINDCWKLNWFSICQESHIQAFIRLIVPEDLRNFVQFMTDDDMKNIISTVLNSIPYRYNFSIFVMFYIHFFPKSSLSECFSLISLFKNSTPYPSLSLYSNIQFLESCNLGDDALGLIKEFNPKYLNAASFHQISQFTAAKAYYLNAMKSDQSMYFYGLSELRSVVINSSLPLCTNLMTLILKHRVESMYPDITLPFFQDTQTNFESSQTYSGNKLTSFISRAHIPYWIHLSFNGEVYQSLKMMQQPENVTSSINEFVRSANVMWIKALDRQMMMTSSLIWRSSILSDIVSHNEYLNPDQQKLINDSISLSQNKVAHLLAKSGTLSIAMKLYPNSNYPSSIPVTTQNLPRLMKFLRSQIPEIQRHPDLYRKLRNSVNIMLRDFNINPVGGQWLRILCQMIMMYKESIDFPICFQRLMNEMRICQVNDANMYIAIAMVILGVQPAIISYLASYFTQMKEEIRSYWLQWLPQLLYINSQLPSELLDRMIQSNPTLFATTIDDMVYSSPQNEIIAHGVINEIKNNNYMKQHKLVKEERAIHEYHAGMSWTKHCEKDINRLQKVVKCHKMMYEGMIRKIPQDRLESLEFHNEEELFQFCENNPPVFTTDIQITDYKSFTGFKFHKAQYVLSVSIECDGLNEAELRFVTMRGETKTFLIVSPDVYPLSQRERIITEVISRCIEKHPAMPSKSQFFFYPYSFLISENLLLVDSMQFANLATAVQPINIPRTIRDTALSKRINATNSTEVFLEFAPKACKEKKENNIPNDLLYRWMVQGSYGSLIDFIFLRQSFVSYFASFSFMHFLFQTQIPQIPSLMLFKDRQRVCIPDFFMTKKVARQYLPITDQIKGVIPKFMFHGSFTASWQIIADSIMMRKDRLQITLQALTQQDFKNAIKDNDRNSVNLIKQQKRIVNNAMVRLSVMNMTEETDKCDDIFPFKLLEHLIDNSWNVLKAQPIAFAWV
ncbi:hypothetical protein TRFO_17893 [Tritrichomonas foetus]|uniref:Uncharacterized protein n=1 Tax=Tritrichomonas foetus TaxID=1144522 RepID=A0A1J4KN36_9EUKA|nr:hypothetical protein TRFO_17893 [Tritrichomonas foetus]|eukprot:OHT12312.1 hypothetical protein TRFO_17893 [Tritrichomonas foetus]